MGKMSKSAIRKRKRRKHNQRKKRNYRLLVTRDGEVCNGCGETENLTIDHVRPILHEGGNQLLNLQLLCPVCNSLKGSMLPEEWEAKIKGLAT